MSLAVVLGTIALVASMIIRVSGAFPGGEATSPDASLDGASPSFSVEQVHEAAERSSNSFESIVNELISHQAKPDYERAEASREELVRFSGLLMGELQEFELTLLGSLDGLMYQTE